MPDPVCIIAAGNRLGEGPVWDDRDQALWWVDIEGCLLQRWRASDGAMDRWTLPERIGSFALREPRGLVVALASGFALFDPEGGAVERLAAPEAHRPGNRFNDGKCDRAGRFWAGTMDDGMRERSGALYRLGADRACLRMAAGIGISNGLAWSPDDRTMYFADSAE